MGDAKLVHIRHGILFNKIHNDAHDLECAFAAVLEELKRYRRIDEEALMRRWRERMGGLLGSVRFGFELPGPTLVVDETDPHAPQGEN
jgi:hypothetical protein